MKSREQMPRNAELDSPRRVIVSCSWDTSTSADEGGQGGRVCVWGGQGGGRLAYLPKTCPSKSDHPACFTPDQTQIPPANAFPPPRLHPANAWTRETASCSVSFPSPLGSWLCLLIQHQPGS